MQIRVRWPIAARVCAALLAAILALQLLPGLLTPPDPAPLPPDVGLIGVDNTVRTSQQKPRLAWIASHRHRPSSPRETRHRPDHSTERRFGRVMSGGEVRRRAKPSEGKTSPHAKIHPSPSARGTSQRKSGPTPGRQDPPEATPVAEAVPAPPPEVVPEAPLPDPAPPDDGSMEFAPR
jgi:hypothetical protein